MEMKPPRVERDRGLMISSMRKMTKKKKKEEERRKEARDQRNIEHERQSESVFALFIFVLVFMFAWYKVS